jgi:hypothetical protein
MSANPAVKIKPDRIILNSDTDATWLTSQPTGERVLICRPDTVLKNEIPQDQQSKTVGQYDKDFTALTRKAATNSAYKKLANKCYAIIFVVMQRLVQRIKICAEDGQLLVAADRYR